MKALRGLFLIAALVIAARVVLGLFTPGGFGSHPKPDTQTKADNNANWGITPASSQFSVLAGSELRDIEPGLLKAAADAGVSLKLTYAGTLDIVERVNSGEHFDAILPPNGAYPALALTTKPLAREKLFYSRVALGVKSAKARELHWDTHAPTWVQIANAVKNGNFHYAMTNPSSSNTGMSALFAVASAQAGKTEDLTIKEIDPAILKAFLSGQKLTAGSSGWLADAFVKDSANLDAMVNYEAVILRTNDKLAEADKLTLVYPQDGVISADYPLMLLNENQRDAYSKLVAVLKAEPFQRDVVAPAYLRPSIQSVAVVAPLPSASVVELSFPNSLDVIDSVLSAYQEQWRRPATSIFVLDVSGSMEGERISSMREALKFLAGADAATASARYARFQKREHVYLMTFSSKVNDPVKIDFESQALDEGRAQVSQYADAMHAYGGTAIYAALMSAEDIAASEKASDPNRIVSIVLLTDGENNREPYIDSFRAKFADGAPARIFPIMFGEASPDDMNAIAQLTGGRVFDGRKAVLAPVFKEIRGYQ